MNFQKSLFFMDGQECGRAAAFKDFRHGRFGDFHFGVRRAERNGLVLDRDDDADDAAGGDHLVAGLEGREHFGLLFGAAAVAGGKS